MQLNKNKPPKNREFMGLVEMSDGTLYWDFFWWATKEDGINGAANYVDRAFFDMPNILGWIELPEVEDD